MWYCSDLGDYELLDCCDGQRLERWGKYILIRPDPQVVWKNVRRHEAWKSADAVYSRSKSARRKHKKGGKYMKKLEELNDM